MVRPECRGPISENSVTIKQKIYRDNDIEISRFTLLSINAIMPSLDDDQDYHE